jgi:mono/diheme cytochrome c family protein
VSRNVVVLPALLLLSLACGCNNDTSSKSDAALGLSSQQANGRQLYRQTCAPCHDAHSVPGQNGPSLHSLFKNTFLPSGLPANERFVRQTILNGRNMMPAAGSALSPQQLDDLLAYLHTL